MDNAAIRIQPNVTSDSEAQRRMNGRLGRLTRDRESLREMRAILNRIYGKGAVANFKDMRS